MHFQLFILFLQSLIANSSAFLKQDALFLDPQPLAHQSLYHRRFATLEIQDEFYGHRNVSYFVTSAGLALIDGDVVYGPVEDLLTHSTNQSITEEVSTQSFSVQSPRPSARVHYKYDSDTTETALRGVVPVAISRWKGIATYLNFVPIANSDAPIHGVLTITSTWGVDNGNANIGYGSDPHTMNLCSSNCGADQATQEYGHTLGRHPD
jgi:hypothetical protein